MRDLKIVSLNVKGFNNVIKRQKILAFLRKEKTQIALLSETHLNYLKHLKLRRSWVGQVYYSSYNTNSRGVAILIHRSLPFTLEKTIKDNDGRYILISAYLRLVAYTAQIHTILPFSLSFCVMSHLYQPHMLC